MKKHKIFYGWWIVAACAVIQVYVTGAIMYGFTSIIKPVALETSWSYAQISFAASLRGMELSILAPIVGALVDRWGPRKLMFAGSIIMCLGLILLSSVNSLVMFYVAFILIAIGASTTTSTVTFASVNNWFHKNLSMTVGIVACGSAVGGLLLPLVTGLIDNYGWRDAVLYIGYGVLILCLPLSLVLRHKPEQYGQLPDGATYISVVKDKRQITPPKTEGKVKVKQILANRAFLHIALASVFQFSASSAISAHIMPYLESIDFSRASASMVASIMILMGIPGRLGAGWAGDKYDKKTIMVMCFVLNALSLFCFSYISSAGLWVLIPYILLHGISTGGAFIIRASMMRDYFGRNQFGTAFGALTGVISLVAMAGPPLAGWIFDKWGSYQGAWLAFAVLSTLSVIIMATAPPPDKNNVNWVEQS